MNIQAFLDTFVKDTFEGTNENFNLCQAMIEVGFVAVNKDKGLKQFFPFGETEPADVRLLAAKWLEENGGEPTRNNPYPGVRVTRKAGTSFVKSTDEDAVFSLAGYKAPDPRDTTVRWPYFPNFDLLLASVTDWESYWFPEVENAMPEDVLGEPVWILFERKPDPTFVRDDPETWTQYNSYTYTQDNGEEKTTAQYYDYVSQVFITEDEARQWMVDNGHEIAGDMATGKADNSGGLPMPEGFIDLEAGNWTSESEWHDVKDDLVKELTKMVLSIPVSKVPAKQKERADAIEAVANNWLLSVDVINRVLAMMGNEPPL